VTAERRPTPSATHRTRVTVEDSFDDLVEIRRCSIACRFVGWKVWDEGHLPSPRAYVTAA
jgi:hypothetical protein